MELSPLLEHFVQTGFTVAESQLQEGNEVLPQVTLLAQDDEGSVFAPILSTEDIFGSRGGKRILPTLIQGIWAQLLAERPHLKLLAITVMADTWIEETTTTEVGKKILESRFTSPSQKPGSQEAIIVQLTLEDSVKVFKWPYVRVGEEVLFSGQPEETKKSGVVFPGLWPL